MVVLLGIPRAPAGAPEPLGQLEQADHLTRRARGTGVDEQRGEVVGLDPTAVELLQRDSRDVFARKPQALHHGDRRRRVEVLQERELHVGQRERAVTLCDQQRPRQLDEFDGTTVDDTRVALHGVDPEAHPGQVGERQAGHDGERDLATGLGLTQQRDRAFRHHRVPRHRVDDLTVLGGRRDEHTGDLGVRVLEIGRGVVDRVERLERDALGHEVVDRRVPPRPHEAYGGHVDGGARHREHVVGTGRSEAHDDDPARHHHGPIRRRCCRSRSPWAHTHPDAGSRSRSEGRPRSSPCATRR